MRVTGGVAAFLLLLAAVQPLAAQEARPDRQGQAQAENRRGEQPQQQDGLSLPAAVTKDASIKLDGQDFPYTVTTGALVLKSEDGKPRAEIGYFAYVAKTGGHDRPITFAVNGGPGAGSAFLNLGAVGPRVLPLDDLRPSARPALIDNPETWLDFTDLVFIDPVGTGWSKAARGVDDKDFWSVHSDARSLVAAIRRYLVQNDRRRSPVFLLGESYGGFRMPLVADMLRQDGGVGVSGLVLISPVLDFSVRSDSGAVPMRWVTRLPTLAAVKLGGEGPVTREKLADAERYASGAYLVDLLKGPNDKAAVDRMATRLAELTGLDKAELAQEAGHLELGSIVEAIRRRTGKVPSLYDAEVLGLDPDPASRRSRADDPVLDTVVPILESAMEEHAREDLGYAVDDEYQVLNKSVSRRWEYPGLDAPESASNLQAMLAADPKLRVIVAHGFTDLVTPYFESKLVLDQLPDIGGAGRVQLDVFPGGHMFYTRSQSRGPFHDAAKAMYDAVLD